MRYSSYGSFDDQPLLDGDEGFRGMNTRVEPGQLQNGEVSLAKNMRFDKGVAESRKGSGLYMDSAFNQVIVNEGILDAVDYESTGDNDHILVACQNKAYIWDNSALDQVNYPQSETITEGFLLNTRVNTLLFRGKGLTLPFAEGSQLGESPLRLAKGETEFKYWKQQDSFGAIYSSSGIHTSVLTDCTFDIGEKFRFSGAPGNWDDYAWEVVSISGDTVSFQSSDNQTLAGLQNFSGTPCIVYSLEDQCPPADFATWAGNRLIVPTGIDELTISSPLSTHDFPIINRLVIGSGDSGNITALEPLSDDSLLVFKNHSIYAVSGVYEMKSSVQGGRLAINRITDQLGCIARDTIQVIGSDIVFLSPQGLYGLALNAKGAGAVGLPVQAVRVADIPLSLNIDNLIPGINQVKASGVFHRGRYYLFDGSDGCLVYNTLLQAWESMDDLVAGGIKLMSVNNTSARILVLNQNHGLVELETGTDGKDYFIGGSSDYESKIETRGYRCNSYEQKHWRRIQVSWEALSGANAFDVQSQMSNPDFSETLYSISPVSPGTFLSRAVMTRRGESVQLHISNNFNGRIKVIRTLVEACAGSRQTTTY